MPGTENSGYLVQLQSPEGDNVYPIISSEMIKDAAGNTYDLSSMKESVDGMGSTYATKTELSSVSSTVSELSSDVQECFQSVSEGKSAIASAITGKGVSTAADATFQTMANNINSIETKTTLENSILSSCVWNMVTPNYHNFSVSVVDGPTKLYLLNPYGLSRELGLYVTASLGSGTLGFSNSSFGNISVFNYMFSLDDATKDPPLKASVSHQEYCSASVASCEFIENDAIYLTIDFSPGAEDGTNYFSWNSSIKDQSTKQIKYKIKGTITLSCTASGSAALIYTS